jgi:hypothetical protein
VIPFLLVLPRAGCWRSPTLDSSLRSPSPPLDAARNIAASAGIGVNDDIGYTDPTKAQRFLAAVVKQEQGGASAFYPGELYASAVGGVPAVASTQPGAPTPGTAPSLSQSLQQGDVGGALAALTAKQGKDADKPSALEQIGKTFEPKQQQGGFQESAPMLASAGGGGGASTLSRFYGPASQLLAQATQMEEQPLSWSTAPPGAGIAGPQFGAAGPQPPPVTAPRGVPTMPGLYGLYAPGTTLNSLWLDQTFPE